MNTPTNPNAQIARFDDWRNVPFEMAYEPGPHDQLKWELGPDYRKGPYDVPFARADGNGTTGRLYGTNSIPTVPKEDMHCMPYVDACSNEFHPHKTPGRIRMQKK